MNFDTTQYELRRDVWEHRNDSLTKSEYLEGMTSLRYVYVLRPVEQYYYTFLEVVENPIKSYSPKLL